MPISTKASNSRPVAIFINERMTCFLTAAQQREIHRRIAFQADHGVAAQHDAEQAEAYAAQNQAEADQRLGGARRCRNPW
jgi:hypothetical protein